MAVEVILPRVDMDMTTGKITKWFVAEGETVARGEALFEIESVRPRWKSKRRPPAC